METRELVERAFARDLKDPGALEDAFAVVRLLEEEDFKEAHRRSDQLRYISAVEAAEHGNVRMLEANHKLLLFDAPYKLDCYLQALEWNREPKDKFYLPRRKILKRVVDALQALMDDELDEVFLSMPPRVGKTSILMFFVTWLIGRDSEKSNLYSAYSDVITSAFYNGCLEILNDPSTYAWKEIFPNAELVSTNSKDETLNIDRKKRYPSLTCRSLYGTLNGACDCNGVLMSDDLIGGIEEALSPDRMASAWYKVDNNLIPRAKEQAKVVWCGTRWSIVDPAGVRLDLLANDEKYRTRRYKAINLPALNENEVSNFDYAYGVGFSTEYYQQRRASFERNNDMASWMAQYMGEPIERSGALFDPADMKFYNGVLPDEEPIRIFMAIDPAFGGGDFTAAPICYQYGSGDIYVADVVYSDGDKRITIPLICQKAQQHHVQAIGIEATKSLMSYKDEVDRALRARNIITNITTKAAPANKAKEQRIFDKAPEIRDFYFLEDGKRKKDYSQFMQNVFSFKLTGKNKHDDAPDSLAQAANMIRGTKAKVSVFQRPF